MRATLLAAASFLFPYAAFAAAPPAEMPIVADAQAPKGRLTDAARPTAYRLDFTIRPDQPRFSGHAEIDAVLKTGTRILYLHGRDLNITKAVALVGGKSVPIKWSQVDKTGVARLDFPSVVPAGAVTLAFDYDAAFGDSPAGLHRIKVGDSWYGWTQFESIDARAAFPSFDEPGFKTPFTISITTRAGDKAVSNAPETAVTKVGALEKHQFQATKPLPTYLIAMMAGPFVSADGAAPPSAYRTTPLPMRIVATKAQSDKLAYALAESPRIVGLLEDYFGQAFPFPKLDQIGSPVMPGAMENAGADLYADEILLLDAGATTRQKQDFGMVVAHELSHQWFGDLVTPAWWDDIWLNESFANWMGYRIGNAWRPELNIGVGAISEALAAMNTDSLEVGRPIHQTITQNSQIDGAFDAITYGKGGQVVAMIAAYLGDDAFRAGVRLHLSRHQYGNATSEEFFQALADAAHDPRVLTSLKSFVDQQGVPLLDVKRDKGGLVVTQQRYAFLGSKPAPITWTIPVCMRVGDKRSCTLMDKTNFTVATAGPGAIMPNAGGTGYYRFNLPKADWDALIAASPNLPAGEALATIDSLWASFRAGKAEPAELIAAMRVMSGHKDSNVAVNGGQRLAGLRVRGLIADDASAEYRRLMDATFAPRLAAIGFDPAAGAHADDDPDRQKLRQDLVALLSDEAQDAPVRAKLLAAGEAYVGGNAKAVDQAFLGTALGLVVEKGGLTAAKSLANRALASEDPIFRGAALDAVSGTGDQAIARWLLKDFSDPRLRATERLTLVGGLARTSATRDMAGDWIVSNYQKTAGTSGIFQASRLPTLLSWQCSAERAQQIDTALSAKVAAMGAGELAFERVVEAIRHCGDLKAARGAALTGAVKASAAG